MTDQTIRLVPFSRIPPGVLVRQMNDPRVARYLPLLTLPFDDAKARHLIAAKSAAWGRDGLGHWGIYRGTRFLGWGGFEKVGEDWDFGLVLMPDAFGEGPGLLRLAMDFARNDPRIRSVIFLLDPARPAMRALERLGAVDMGESDHGGQMFRTFRIKPDTLARASRAPRER